MVKPVIADTPDEKRGGKFASMRPLIIVASAMLLVGAAAGFGLGFVSSSLTSDVGKEVTSGKLVADGNADQTKTTIDEKNGDKPSGKEIASTNADKEAVALEHSGDTAPADPTHGGDSEQTGPQLVNLEPVITNITTPADVWIRLEAVLKSSAPLSKDTSDLIHQDFMAFFRSMRIEDLEGGSSFIDLKAELLARANMRADGKIETLYIKTFLFE
jgi:Flagellar basal body-associated protein FliL